jgi:GT2 family glycosyltransferase
MKDKASSWLLNSCLTALRKQEAAIGCMVVDDASPFHEALRPIVTKHSAMALRVMKNGGYSKTVNIGLSRCKSQVAITMNSDVEMQTPFVSRLIEIFKADPKIAVVGCRLLYPYGRIQHAGYEVFDDGIIEEYDKEETESDRRSGYVMGVTGAFTAIRTSALQEIGLLSEKYEMGFEDVEFCLRTWAAGYRVFYDYDIYGIHHESATRGTARGPREDRSIAQLMNDLKRYQLQDIRDKVEVANYKMKVTGSASRVVSTRSSES